MFKSNLKFFILTRITTAMWTGDTFNISPELENDEVIDTEWEEVSIVIKNETQLERLTVTITEWVATIVKRGLNQSDSEVESEWLNKTWSDWAEWYITGLAFNFADLKSDNTFEWNNTFSGDNEFQWDNQFLNVDVTNSLKCPVFADETARDAGITTPLNWMSIYLESIWAFQDYKNGAWETRESAWSDRLVAISNNDTTPWQLDDKIVSSDSTISKTIWSPSWDENLDLSVNVSTTESNWLYTESDWLAMYSATDSQEGTAQIATLVESWEMTSGTKFIVPTQLAWESQIITRLLNIANSSVTYTHSLWRKPRKIRFSYNSVGWGTWAWIYLTNDDTNRTVWDDVSNSLCIDQSNVTWVVTSVTTTDYTISWVNTNSTSATMSVLVDLE